MVESKIPLLFVIARSRNLPSCQQIKLWHTYTIEFYSLAWKFIEKVMKPNVLNEMSQIPEDKKKKARFLSYVEFMFIFT